MRFTRARVLAATLVTAVGLAVLGVPSPASATVTTTNITSPTDGTHWMITDASPSSTVGLTGTSNGTTGDLLDIYCFSVGSYDYQFVANNVAVQADGSFSTTMEKNDPYGSCRLRAVPDGFTPGDDITAYTGPTVTTEWVISEKAVGGPNNNKVFNYYVAYQGAHALNDYGSATHTGLWDTRLSYPDGTASDYLWWGNAALGGTDGTRNWLQVDGRNAYGPNSAHYAFPNNAGVPALTFTATRDGVTGTTTIRETNPLVVCPGSAFPPTSGSCPQFNGTGVRLERTLVATDGGRQVHITDVYRSTDGKPHTISAHYGHKVQGFDYVTGADTAVGLRLPWLGGFQTFGGDSTYPGPAKLANTVSVRTSNTAADPDTLLPRGAVTFDFPLANVRRTQYDTFSLNAATFTVAGGGTRVLRQSFVVGTGEAEVAAKAAANVVRLNPYRTDGLIKKKGAATYVGNGVYNTTGAGQTVGARAKRTRTVTFLVAVQNDGTQPSSYRIKGDGARRGFKFRYLKGVSGTQAITSAVTGGTYLLTVAPGATQTFRLVVTVKAGARIGKRGSWLVVATSTKDASRVDAVRANVRVKK